MKPTQEQVIAWALEAKLYADDYADPNVHDDWFKLNDLHFATLAYEAGYEAGRKDENEACAKVCEHFLSSKESEDAWVITMDLALQAAADVIRRREKQ